MSLWNWKKLWILLCAIPLLTACPPQPKLTLSVSQAVQGESVTASLEGLNGEGARVTVAGLEATVTTATRDSVTFIIPDDAPEGSQEVVILSGDQRATARITIIAKQPGNQTFVLDRKNAARGETVNATTTGVDLSSAKLVVAGQTVTITPTGEGKFSFQVPENALAGSQTVTLETNAGNLDQPLGILGDVVPDKLTILLAPGVNPSRLTELGFRIEQIRNLDPSGLIDGPCSSTLVDIDVNGKPLGQAIEELEKENVALHIDPRSAWGTSSVDHLSAISASIARNNGYTGAGGSTIAVLDTGVSEHPELTNTPGRLVSPFNAITGGTDLADVADDFDDANVVPPIPADKLQPGVEGHGTPIAVLAAGDISGVASEASIMPIKAFGPKGEGFSNDVIVGVCHALTEAPDLKKLILNLSFGGDTPVDALEAILKYALENGVQVAAAAGNEGEFGSPRHYPAAYNLPGLVVVGALEASSLQCVDFDQQTTGGNYIIGSTLSDTNISISFKEFFFVSQGSTTSGFASVAGTGPNKALSTNNINAQFAFAYPVDAISFLYIDQGGSENLEINGDLRAVGNLNDLDGETVGGVRVLVDLLQFEPQFVGQVRLEGDITQFAVGGQEFLLDNVCPSKASSWQPAVFSTRGDYVDISAPGAALRSGTPGGAYANAYEGTSFSTPLVAGAMALWQEADATLTPAQIEANLKRDALPLSFTPSEVGAGLLNLNVAPFNVPPVLLRANSQ